MTNGLLIEPPRQAPAPPGPETALLDPEALLEEARRRGRQRRRRRLIALVGVAIGVAAVGYVIRGGSGSPGTLAAVAKPRPAVVVTARGFGADVAFTARSRRDHDQQVFLLHADGAVSQITHGPGSSVLEGWSPDGSHLLFVRYARHGIDQILYVVGADGRGLVRLNGGNLAAISSDGAGEAAWSPDGSHISFYRNFSRRSDRPPRQGVVIAAWNGRRVTGRVWLPGRGTSGASIGSPWSPDGSHLALEDDQVFYHPKPARRGAVSDNGVHIHVVRADGSADTALTRTDRTTCFEGDKTWLNIGQSYYAEFWSAASPPSRCSAGSDRPHDQAVVA